MRLVVITVLASVRHVMRVPELRGVLMKRSQRRTGRMLAAAHAKTGQRRTGQGEHQ